MKKYKVWMPLLALTVLLGLGLAKTSMVKASESMEIRIVDGVFIGNVDVSDLTEEEAHAKVQEQLDALMGTTFELVSENGTVETTLTELGASFDLDTAVQEAVAVGHSGSLIRRFKETEDLKKQEQVVDLRLRVDNQTAARFLYANGKSLNLPAVNMGLVKEGGSFTTVPGSNGNEVDYVASVSAINDAINNWTVGDDTTIKLVCNTVQFKGSESELAKVKDCLGSFSTYFGTGNTGREINVRNGCSLVNGAVVYPGDEFSVNVALSPYTYENGYQEAGSYENGQVVNSMGGGICQVSTTLYNAVIRAELEVTQRAPHSMVVTYVDLSGDAAIAGDYKDLKFKNNTDAPIYIEGYCSGGNICFNIYGQESRAAGRKVDFVSETLSEDKPATNFNLSGDVPLGYYHKDVSSHIGYNARLWKIVYQDGVEQSRDVFNNSTYRASAGTTTVGVAGATEEQLAAINAAIAQAIATKDDQVVEDTVAALAAPPAPVETPQPQAPQQPSEPQNPSQDTTQNPTQDPTQKPTQEPTQNPTQDPTQTPNQDSTQNPGSNTNVDGNNPTTVTQ